MSCLRGCGGGRTLGHGSGSFVSRLGVLEPSHLRRWTIAKLEEGFTLHEREFKALASQPSTFPCAWVQLHLSHLVTNNRCALNGNTTHPLSFLAAIRKMIAGFEVVSMCAEASWLWDTTQELPRPQ